MERKDNHIRKLQCQKNLQSANELTFTPKIVHIFLFRIRIQGLREKIWIKISQVLKKCIDQKIVK